MGTPVRLQSQCGFDPVLGVPRITLSSLIDWEDLENSQSHTHNLLQQENSKKTSKGNGVHAANPEGNQAQVPKKPLPVWSQQDTVPSAAVCDSTHEIMSTTDTHL